MATVGLRLKFAREQAGLTIPQAAVITGFTQDQIKDFESATYLHMDGRLVFPEKYGVSLRWLLEGGEAETFILKNFNALADWAMKSGKPRLMNQLLDIAGLSRTQFDDDDESGEEPDAPPDDTPLQERMF